MQSFIEALNNSKNAEIFVTLTISLFLHILHRAKAFEEKTNEQENLCKKLRDNTRMLMKEWVVCPGVIGGSIFGSSVKYAGSVPQELKKEEQELKVRSITNLKFYLGLVLGELSFDEIFSKRNAG